MKFPAFLLLSGVVYRSIANNMVSKLAAWVWAYLFKMAVLILVLHWVFLIVCLFVFVFVFLPFLGLLPWHMRVSRLGVKLEL